VKDLNNTNKVTCNFCLLTSSGGITRAWKHQLGISGQAACSKTPEDVKVLLKADLDRKKRKKQVLKELRAQVDDVVRHDAAELQRTQNGKRPAEPSLQAAKKKKGLMDY
jgi:thermostable 8-oxoguanine DNA glycosylase